MALIYFSTGGFYKKSALESCIALNLLGVNQIELSGGLWAETLESDLIARSREYNFIVHNYFPPPKNSFVLNLASLDKNIELLSMRHCENAIRLAEKLKSKYFSFHAGFLLDPRPDQLGKKITNYHLFNRTKAKAVFIKNLKFLSEVAARHNVELLIENNVFSASNGEFFKENPFLMTEYLEAIEIMENTPENINLLIDVAHLKVSANTQNFSKIEFLEKTEQWTKGYHLSDNDGTKDSNEKMTEESWFWKHLNKKLNYYTIEVYNCSDQEIIEQISLAKRKIL